MVRQPCLEGVVLRLAAPSAVQALEHLFQPAIGRAQFRAVARLKGVEMLDLVASEGSNHEFLLDHCRLDCRHFLRLCATRRRYCPRAEEERCGAGQTGCRLSSHSRTHIVRLKGL